MSNRKRLGRGIDSYCRSMALAGIFIAVKSHLACLSVSVIAPSAATQSRVKFLIQRRHTYWFFQNETKNLDGAVACGSTMWALPRRLLSLRNAERRSLSISEATTFAGNPQ
jgi:hypothetical protein